MNICRRLTRLLITTAILATAAPLAQAATHHRNRAQGRDPEQAALTAAWQAYRGLPGGPPARPVADPERAALTAAWQAYRGLPGGPPTGLVPATDSGGFDWGDAGIGAAGMLGIVFLLGGIAAALITARRHRRQPKPA